MITLILGKIQGDGREFLDCFKREANSPATYSCRDYNTQPINDESGAPTTELSRWKDTQ